jgi:hypothetical protein
VVLIVDVIKARGRKNITLASGPSEPGTYHRERHCVVCGRGSEGKKRERRMGERNTRVRVPPTCTRVTRTRCQCRTTRIHTHAHKQTTSPSRHVDAGARAGTDTGAHDQTDAGAQSQAQAQVRKCSRRHR